MRSDQPIVRELCARLAVYRGKMLRPMLLLLTAEAGGGVRREHITLAAVVELVHMATLVHDDVLDEAELRRRTATINRLHGNEAAVLLGDYLISHAYHLCSSLGSQHAARRIAATTNTVCEGELMQVAQRGNWSLTEEQYLDIIRRKTASLTAVCCELGAHFAGMDADAVGRMSGFGADIGMAFQIVDDLLDLTGDETQVGKPVGRDAALGKLTLPLIHALCRAEPADRERMIERLDAGRFRLNGHHAPIRDGLDYAASMARSFVQSAVARLSDLPSSDARDALAAAAEFVLRRRA